MFGISDNMLNTLGSCMSRRSFRVKVGSALSRVHVQENGSPQNGVLSCTLFGVEMNCFGKILQPAISYLMQIDEVEISYKSRILSICEQVHISVKKNLLAMQTNRT